MKRIAGRTNFAVVVVVVLLFAGAVWALTAFGQAQEKREAERMKKLQPQIAQLQAQFELHARQLANGRMFWIWGTTDSREGGLIVHLEDNHRHLGEIFVPEGNKFQAEKDKAFHREAQVRFALKKKLPTVNADNYERICLLDFVDVEVVKPGIGVVPEPGTIVVMGLGLAGLYAKRRKRKPA